MTMKHRIDAGLAELDEGKGIPHESLFDGRSRTGSGRR